MRTSTIAGFTPGMGAGHGAVFAKKPVDATNRHPIAKAETGRSAEFLAQFRLPAHPLVYDIAFPGSAAGDGRSTRLAAAHTAPRRSPTAMARIGAPRRRAGPNRRLRGRSDQHRQSAQERRTEFKSSFGRRTGRRPYPPLGGATVTVGTSLEEAARENALRTLLNP
jgi:hypothetical protein